MTSLGFNLNFLHNKEEHINIGKTPYTKALVGLMMLTGIERLFEKEDVYELIKRAQILLPEQRMIDRFFTDDSLFSFQIEKLTYQFTITHLKSLIGLETLDSTDNYIPFSKWQSSTNFRITMYNMLVNTDVLKGLKLTAFESEITRTEEGVLIDFSKTTTTNAIVYTEEHLKQAEFFGKTISNEFPESMFDRIKEEFPNKIKQLELRRMPFNEPVFNFEAYPIETQHALWKHFWPEMEYFNDREYRIHYVKLIYLAWLWANGFVIEDSEGLYYVDARVKTFKLEDYEDEDGGTNLETTYEDDTLWELEPILYNVKIANLALRPRESLDINKKKH